MQVMIAVIDDLFQFVKASFSGAVLFEESLLQTETTYQEKLEKVKAHQTSLQFHSDVLKVPSKQDTFRVGNQYFVGSIGMYLYDDPIIAFDNARLQLQYGQPLRLVFVKGRWAQVALGNLVGWVLKDALAVQAENVYPRFTQGEHYPADNTETIKLRAAIDDAFGGARGNYPISAAEYVQYALQQKKREIPWGEIRTRVPGTWQRKLRGIPGIHIGILPKTESVMEYIEDELGHLAFVEAVFPDGTIKISEMGKYDDAVYTEEVLTPEQYKELRPVFIEIT